jgi:hypothetical protein
MRSVTQFSAFGAAAIAAALLLAPVAADAAHGKAGLWTITTKMEMPGMPQMPDLSQMPPEVQARMKAMHVRMSGKGMTVQHCMTQAEVDQDKPPAVVRKDCKLVKSSISGKTYTGEVACTGEFKGDGKFTTTFDSNEHYTGSMDMHGSHDGTPMNMHPTFEGRWVSASCGSVTH